MKKIIQAAAIAVIVAFLLICIKNEYAYKLPSGTYGMQTAISKGSIQNLFIGSSMFRQGLDIDILEQELTGNTYILSYNGNQPVFMARELAYMLEQGLTVENLYIDLYGYTAAAPPWLSDTKILLDTDMVFKIETWNLMKENNETGFLDFYELFVTANNEQILTYPIHNKLISSQFRNGGTTIQSAGQTKEALDALESLGTRDGLNAVQVEGYREIIRLAQENNIHLVFIETPKYDRMYKDETYQMLLQECTDAVSGEQIILSEKMEFDNSDAGNFQDLIHLSSQGRKSYTEQLCGYLR